MRVGYILPCIGPLATTDNLVAAAERAESLGFDHLWVTDRLLFPENPRSKYPGTPDGSLPEEYRTALDPLTTLAYVAATTKTIGLGTSILDIPFYNPVVLARSLAALDVLSSGRLRVGLGLGWSEDEYAAAGAPMHARGRRATEHIRVLKAAWGPDPVEFEGEFYRIPKSDINPKPVQAPLRISLAAFTPPGLKRAATVADGWHPGALGPRLMRKMLDQLFDFATEAGRDPAELEVVVRANTVYSDQPRAEKGWPFTGNAGQIRGDIAAMRDLGATDLFFDTTFSSDHDSLAQYLARMEQLRELAG